MQRLHSVRRAVRKSLSNLKKSYRSLLDLSFPELGNLLEIDGVGIRHLIPLTFHLASTTARCGRSWL